MDNIYLIGMCISMALFLLIGFLISRKVKGKNDFYVAGRNAPVLLIAGSLIASYTSTGVFMGDAATFYDGGFSAMILLSGMQVAGYILGAVLFGRYLRRSQVYTIPEFFGKRFCSIHMRRLSAVTAVVTMVVYLLSTIQGIGTLMSIVTGLDYRICVVIATTVFMVICISSGSRGVLITDTIMATIFTVAAVISVIFIANENGGWFASIDKIASDETLRGLLSWSGRPGALYDDGISNIAWGLIYGVVWMSVCMAGPWQSSRYLMAKDESTVINSSFIAALGIFLLEFLVGMAAVFVNLSNPELNDTSHVLIWAAMNILPKILGVLLLTGVLSAGISSATTFLSLIGSSVANMVILFCLYFYSLSIGSVRAAYHDAAGLWWEARYRALLETIMNVALNFLLTYLIGVAGTVISTILSILVINYGYGTQIVFKHYFKGISSKQYYIDNVIYFFACVVAATITFISCYFIPLTGILEILVKLVICCILPNLIFLLLFFKSKLFKENLAFVKVILHRRRGLK